MEGQGRYWNLILMYLDEKATSIYVWMYIVFPNPAHGK
jgi:hypothetical protein